MSRGKKMIRPVIADAIETNNTAPAAVSLMISARLSYSINRESHICSMEVLKDSAAKTIPMHRMINIHSV